jgi:hypothetical protein
MMNSRLVEERHHVLALAAAVTELGDGCGGIGLKACAVVGIDPGTRHDFCAIARPDPVLISVDQDIERFGVDIALVDQELFERKHPQLDVGQGIAMGFGGRAHGLEV